MIEITTAVVEKVQTLMHENAGFIMSKNVERILDDLAKQAEVFGVSMTSIPVTMKMTISVDDFGVHLTFDSVTWQKTMRASDKACYTVDYDPRQPNLPGFDQADQANQAEKQQPVIDVKALPVHENDGMVENSDRLIDLRGLLLTHDDGHALIDVCRHNIEAITDANAITVLAPSPYGDSRVMRYAHGEWKMQVVPNVQETLEAADDGECIVFGVDGKLTTDTMEKLKKNGYGILSTTADTAVAHVCSYTNNGCWMEEKSFPNNKDGNLQMINYLRDKLANDDCLLVEWVIFYDMK